METNYPIDPVLCDAGYRAIIGKGTLIEKGSHELLCMAQSYQDSSQYKLMIGYCEEAIRASNDHRAMIKLGYYYQMVAKDYTMMKKYYDLAICTKPDHLSTYFNYGSYHEHVEKNMDRAVELYTRGYELGDAECANRLGDMNYKCGDEEIACNYYTFASNAGHKGARFSIQMIQHQADKISMWCDGSRYR